MSGKNDAPKVGKAPETKKVEPAKPLAFKLETVTEKPSRRYRKGSKYDGILDAFTKGISKLSKIEIPGVPANYLASQLQKRVKVKKLEKDIDVSVVNNVVYLEKIIPKTFINV